MSELLNGRYELGDIVGSGGMGAVHRAFDTRLGRHVAIKVLRGGALEDEVAQARMRSEAQLASAVHHRGVAQIFDYDAASATHDGMSFIVMELIEGQSLAQLLRQQGSMPTAQVMSVVQQVAEALSAAHAVGVVHRDLKPANIMLTPAGRTVLVDFGIARSASSEPLTETGAIIGTADYVSPEQAAGRSADAQSDLYSLGVVAAHCLTGQSPFRRENHIGTALAHLNDDLPPFDPTVPARVQDLIRRLVEKSPFDRPSSAAEVAAEAADIGAAPSVDVPPTMAMNTDVSATQVQPLMDVASQRRPRSRRSMALFSGVGIAAAVLALLGFDYLRADATAVVPDVVGMDVAQATTMIGADGMSARRDSVDSPGTPAGQVVKQTPEAGEDAPDDGSVVLSVASGKVAVSADGIVGTPYAKAAAALEKLGFEVARVDSPSASDVGDVIALDRSGRLLDGSTITLTVAVAQPEPEPTAASTTATGGAPIRSTPSKSSKPSGKSADKGNSGKAKGKNKGNKSKGKGP